MAAAPLTDPAGTGIYVHIPFCAHRCHYCDFNTYSPSSAGLAGSPSSAGLAGSPSSAGLAGSPSSAGLAGSGFDHLMAEYVEALRRELERMAAAGPRGVDPHDEAPGWPRLTSVFVGGGTPTLLPADDLGGILRLIRDVLPLADDAEITVEANPETVTADGLAALLDAGMNRLSMGAQSFAPHVLTFLGRRHSAERPLEAVEQARSAGVPRISLDLIYGAPAETDSDWAATLDVAVAEDLGHVSAYALTVEANTEYAARIRAGAAAPDEDVQADRMAMADTRLAAAGYERYELSNWARPGQACRHNLTYWRSGNWLAAGAGAHGHWNGRRWWTLRSPARYIEAALEGRPTTAGEEVLDGATRRVERLMMGLRLAEGVSRDEVEPVDETAAGEMVRRGLLDDDGERLRLTRAGMALADAVLVRLLPMTSAAAG